MSQVDMSGVESFLDDGWITEVVGVVKSGKEATVYCCKATPSTGKDYFAAKVYESQETRGFKNDAVYLQGKSFGGTRTMRAVKNRSRRGQRMIFSEWVTSEYRTLERLHRAGADVVQPHAMASNAVLLEWVGDGETAAPQLSSVEMTRPEAQAQCRQLLTNIGMWLDLHVIHGDLSPYNILYHRQRVKVIDFPQAVDPRDNPRALELLTRDIANVCDYFRAYGANVDASDHARRLWQQYWRLR